MKFTAGARGVFPWPFAPIEGTFGVPGTTELLGGVGVGGVEGDGVGVGVLPPPESMGEGTKIVIDREGREAAEFTTGLVATTVKLYVPPLVRPVMTHVVSVVTHVRLPGFEVTV